MKINTLAKRPLGFLWGYVRLYRLHLLKIFGAVIITTSAILSVGVALRKIVDQGMGNPFLLLIVFSIIISISAYVRTSASAWLSETVAAKIKQDLLHHVLYLPQQFFETARLGDLLSRFQTDINQIRTFISASAAVVMRSALQLIGGSILLIHTSSRLTFFVFALIPLIFVPILLLGKKVQKLTKAVQDLDGRSGALIEENLAAMSTVKAFTNEKFCEDQLSQILTDKNILIKSRTHYRSLLISMIIALTFLAIAVIFWMGNYQVKSGSLSMGQLSAFVFYAILVAGSINNLIDKIEECSAALASTDRLLEIFATPTERNISQKSFTDQTQKLEFKQVSFHYPQRKDGVTLNQLSFTIEPLKKVALVGPSGAGKSTLFKLLLRLYDPQEGSILLNNVATSEIALEQVRSFFSLVPQDPMMFNASLLENIRYGQPHATDEDTLKAASSAHIDEFALQLPQGYDTLVGEKGIRLSGGQKQRIALARAILRNAPIFLLDEATNALDSYSEMIVQQTLKEILKNKTAIIIAHRLATVQQADLILLLDQGRLVAQGTHQQLLKTSKLYQTLAETQFIAV